MRIIKYILLLLILFFIGLTVFVTTQKGDYVVIRSKVIKTPRATVFNFINDYRNWETIDFTNQNDKSIQFIYPELTSGKGASYIWRGSDGDGDMKTLAVKENESIQQKMNFDGNVSEVFWTFKDTLGATKVSFRNKGKMDALTKIYAFFSGGIDNIIGAKYEKSLANLDRTLDYEMNTFSIKVNGIVSRPKNFYLRQTINSYENKVVKNIKILIPKMQSFFEKNKMVMHGKPFVVYNSTNSVNKIVNFSVGIPIKDSVYIMPGSEIESGTINAMTAVKTTLIGDYSHLNQAKNKALDYIIKNDLKQNLNTTGIEVYLKTIRDVKNPSKWITELYIPVYPKIIPPSIKSSKPKDSTATLKTLNESIIPKVPNP